MDLPPGSTPLFLSPIETAEYLNIHPQTLVNWRRDKIGPPYVRIGGQIRYRRVSLERWLGGQTTTPATETGV